MKVYRLLALLLLLTATLSSFAQDVQSYWHDQQREIHYKPDQQDFLSVNGKRRFNRALYGSNTAFRAEAGDLPEFALYLPGMGGNLKFGLLSNGTSKWLIDATQLESRYRPGSMIYTIQDGLLDKGKLVLTALPLFDQEGLIIKIETNGIGKEIELLTAFGGATGSRFTRDGDIGADPESSFYLKPEYCKGNFFKIDQQSFSLFFGAKQPPSENIIRNITQAKTTELDTLLQQAGLRMITGIFPPNASLQVGDAGQQQSPQQLAASLASNTAPLIVSRLSMDHDGVYYFLLRYKNNDRLSYTEIPALYEKAEKARREIADRIRVETPDPYINTLGAALSIAADAVWEAPSFMHGAVAWRMRLNGWRGAYAADVLGWHDRARQHFSSYALSQLTGPATGPVVMDTALHLARGLEKLGTSMFSSGYISRNPNGDFRAHHYDMNLVFIDQLLNHFQWTGDTAYARQMWPLLVRHLAWEKRNFDADGDGLYDAYAAIWASDALQYSGGGVTHSSAYNYRANKTVAEIAHLLKEDARPYEEEAQKIIRAINHHLWMPANGSYAEYKDLLGEKLLHPSAGLWTVYHAIDSHVPDIFQSYQLLQYVDKQIPHIPVRAKGITDTSLYTLATTNWQPYTWSLNNVALAEILHTSLAYWQGGRAGEAYTIWKSALIESMYLGASPGNFQQLSFYDAMRGELYRDFADPIAMAARSLVEGLFGIMPDALKDTLYINPGFPASWKHAALKTPDIDFSYQQKNNEEHYVLKPHFPTKMNLLLRIQAMLGEVDIINVNGKVVNWSYDPDAIGSPMIRVALPSDQEYDITIRWKGTAFRKTAVNPEDINGQIVTVTSRGDKLRFVRIKKGDAVYWEPYTFTGLPDVVLEVPNVTTKAVVHIKNNTALPVNGRLFLNGKLVSSVNIKPKGILSSISIPSTGLVTGTNVLEYSWSNQSMKQEFQDWDHPNPSSIKYNMVDLSSVFNDRVTNIFRHAYLSPRPSVATLQLPVQGIGNWAYPLIEPVINDSGLRKLASASGQIKLKQGIPFAIQPDSLRKNILFTSTWNYFPDTAIIDLKGKASHAYLLMAGSTNPMQSRLVNGAVRVEYKDGTSQTLELKNPENWWPIEQDYFEDGFAFTTDAPKPLRVHLKTGKITRAFDQYTSIKGFTNRAIDGGAATVLDLPLDPGKELKRVVLKAVANDVIIGLMSLTLVRQ
jgi:hypothetical protein